MAPRTLALQILAVLLGCCAVSCSAVYPILSKASGPATLTLTFENATTTSVAFRELVSNKATAMQLLQWSSALTGVAVPSTVVSGNWVNMRTNTTAQRMSLAFMLATTPPPAALPCKTNGTVCSAKLRLDVGLKGRRARAEANKVLAIMAQVGQKAIPTAFGFAFTAPGGAESKSAYPVK